MMLHISLLAALSSVVLATLDKPAIQPAFDLDGSIEAQLRQYLPQKAFSYSEWSPGWVPQDCYDAATDNGLSPMDYDVYDVTYTDCSESWVICRHKDSPLSATDIFTLFGQIPVGMREYVADLVANPAANAVAYTVGAYTVIFGDWFHLGTMAHEFTHVLDLIALEEYVSDPGSQPFSDTSYWQTPQDRDTALPTGYAATTWQEDFAEAGRVALSDIVVPGGLAGINPNSSQIQWQVDTYKDYLQSTIFPSGGSCTGKTPSSSPVPVSQSAKIVKALGPKPDVGLSGEVPEIVVPEGAKKFKFVYPLPEDRKRV